MKQLWSRKWGYHLVFSVVDCVSINLVTPYRRGESSCIEQGQDVHGRATYASWWGYGCGKQDWPWIQQREWWESAFPSCFRPLSSVFFGPHAVWQWIGLPFFCFLQLCYPSTRCLHRATVHSWYRFQVELHQERDAVLLSNRSVARQP